MFFNKICNYIVTFSYYSKRFEVLNTRAGRAGVIHNFMRGLSLQKTFPLSPFTPDEANKQNGMNCFIFHLV